MSTKKVNGVEVNLSSREVETHEAMKADHAAQRASAALVVTPLSEADRLDILEQKVSALEGK